MAIVYATNIRKFNEEDYNRLIHIISKDRLNTINKFLNKEDCIRSLVGEAVLRIKLGEIMDMDPKNFIIKKKKGGKPFFENVPSVKFNISHSGDWVVIVLSHQKCGIDIEKIEKLHIEIAQHFFTENEYIQFFCKEKEKRKELFYILWTIKESYIKFDGRGLRIPLNSFEVKINNGEYKLILTQDKERKCKIKLLEIDPQYKMSVCTLDNYILYKRVSLNEINV